MGAERLKEAQREEKTVGEELTGGRLREPYSYHVRYVDAGHDCQAEICVTKSHRYGYDLRLTLGVTPLWGPTSAILSWRPLPRRRLRPGSSA